LDKNTVNGQIVEILIHSSIDNFQPATTAKQRTKADVYSFSQHSIKLRVSGILGLLVL